jgi:hypothetical protein
MRTPASVVRGIRIGNRCSTSRVRFEAGTDGKGDDIESGSPLEISKPEPEVHRSNHSGEGREPEGARTSVTSVPGVEARKGTDSNLQNAKKKSGG